MASSGALTSVSGSPPLGTPSPLPQFSDAEELLPVGPQTEMLGARELDLLGHYLTHTARSIAFDRKDLYALKVGMPNLAFRSKPLMNSVLALAAVSRSRDFLDAPMLSPQGEAQVRELLIFAERRHTESLRQIQAYAMDPQYYDYVLANAALMVQYGSASHCMRIRLMGMTPTKDTLPSEVLPVPSQWISLVRAVHVALAGLRNELPEPLFLLEQSPELRSGDLYVDMSATYGEDVILPEAGPSKETEQLLLPIVAATAESALDRLEARARSWAAGEGKAQMERTEDCLPYQPDPEACLETIKILRGVYAEVVWPEDASRQGGTITDPLPSWNKFGFGQEQPPQEWLVGVQPWIRSYLARVTSLTPSRPPRRTVVAFLSRVPPEFLDLVQTTLDSLPVRNDGGGDDGPSTLACAPPVQRLAMDIFAHWLVLVMLLDGVWWIGGIGIWELGRVVAAMQMTGDWWPESMYKVGRELGKHKQR
jgi:hypothetical protein